MKTLRTISLALALSLSLAGTAQADYGHHSRHGGHGGHSRHHGSGWGGTAALLAITGVAIGATAYQYYQPPPVYSPQPRTVYAPPPDPGIWYYCASSGQYHPYVQHCPEGWAAVTPPR